MRLTLEDVQKLTVSEIRKAGTSCVKHLATQMSQDIPREVQDSILTLALLLGETFERIENLGFLVDEIARTQGEGQT